MAFDLFIEADNGLSPLRSLSTGYSTIWEDGGRPLKIE
jgi:hypothetical protein